MRIEWAVRKLSDISADGEACWQPTERNAREPGFMAGFRACRRKLRGSRGESLVEVLVAILVAALSVALLFTCVTASVSINKSAEEADGEYYEALTDAEVVGTSSASEAGVVISNATESGSSASVEVEVKLYGGSGMYSYEE